MIVPSSRPPVYSAIGRALPLIALANVLWIAPVHAQEQKTYQYDAHGRLIAVTSNRQAVGPVETRIEYDDADNRTRYQVSGAPNSSGGQPPEDAGAPAKPVYAVLPLKGFTVMRVR